jgi:hypothetical protein
MTVRSMSAQPHQLFGTNWRFQIAIMRIFNRIGSDLSSPKAEVRGSNPFGRASFSSVSGFGPAEKARQILPALFAFGGRRMVSVRFKGQRAVAQPSGLPQDLK